MQPKPLEITKKWSVRYKITQFIRIIFVRQSPLKNDSFRVFTIKIQNLDQKIGKIDQSVHEGVELES